MKCQSLFSRKSKKNFKMLKCLPSMLSINPFSTVDQNRYFYKNVDPDEVALNEPSHLGLHSLPFCY